MGAAGVTFVVAEMFPNSIFRCKCCSCINQEGNQEGSCTNVKEGKIGENKNLELRIETAA